MKEMLDIGWAIIHIRGIEGFQEELLPKLRGKYMSANSDSDNVMMIWVSDVKKLRSLKLAVGSKIILKYRLHFLAGPTEHSKAPNNSLNYYSSSENHMENQMTVWQNTGGQQPETI